MDAIQVIKRDHRAVEELYAEYKRTDDDIKKAALAEEILDSLDAHAHMEETYFYPELLKEGEKEEGIIRHANAEHNDIKFLIAQARGEEGEELDRRLKDVIDSVNHHVREEESDLLPDARRVLGEQKLEKLGAEMEPHSAVEKTHHLI